MASPVIRIDLQHFAVIKTLENWLGHHKSHQIDAFFASNIIQVILGVHKRSPISPTVCDASSNMDGFSSAGSPMVYPSDTQLFGVSTTV